MYQLTGVTRLYAKGGRTVPAVRDLDLVIGDGEWLAGQGRPGHGKSTLLNLLGGLGPATPGALAVAGPAHLGSKRVRRAGPGAAPRNPGDQAASRIDRVHLPDVQPGAHAVSGRECRSRPDSAQAQGCGTPPPGGRRA